jgi:RNA polymerase sigma factor (sigma-70 family)
MAKPDDRPAGDPHGSPATRNVDLESTVRLIERAQAGDQDALDRLVARHLTPLRRWARGRLPKWARDLADTDDLVQDTLVQTFKRIGSFEVRGPGALQAYLRQSILNRVRDEIRKKSRRPDVTELDGLEVDGRRSPLEETISGEAIERYEQALATLRPDEREAIIGRVEMGYSYAELADALGKPSSEAARKAARRALVALVQRMEREEK